MASVSAIRDGIKTRLQTITGLRVHDIIPEDVQPPAAVVVPAGGAFDATMGRGSDDMVFEIRLAVSDAVTRAAQDALDAYLAGSGASSIKAAVDGNLGGAVHFARVAGWDGYGDVTIGGVSYYGVTFTVEVTGAGSS